MGEGGVLVVQGADCAVTCSSSSSSSCVQSRAAPPPPPPRAQALANQVARCRSCCSPTLTGGSLHHSLNKHISPHPLIVAISTSSPFRTCSPKLARLVPQLLQVQTFTPPPPFRSRRLPPSPPLIPPPPHTHTTHSVKSPPPPKPHLRTRTIPTHPSAAAGPALHDPQHAPPPAAPPPPLEKSTPPRSHLRSRTSPPGPSGPLSCRSRPLPPCSSPCPYNPTHSPHSPAPPTLASLKACLPPSFLTCSPEPYRHISQLLQVQTFTPPTPFSSRL
jgi:hypothetical protein